MTIKTLVFGLLLSFLSSGAVAGAGHDHSHSHHPVSQSQAEETATKSVSMLVDKGKLDASWKLVKVTQTKQEKFSGHQEWVVSFKNEKVSDPSKQTLYVFLSLSGEYLAANYTGK